jgi:hypothetical protein
MSEQGKREREESIFATFLELEPSFAGCSIEKWSHIEEWHQAGYKSPDIICTDSHDRLIGVEMTEWLHEEQTRAYWRWNELLSQVKPLSGWSVYVHLEIFARDCDKKDRRPFVGELSRAIVHAASRPEVRPSGLTTFAVDRLTLAKEAPIVARYCQVISGARIGSGQVALLSAASAYSSRDAAESLQVRIGKKTRKYVETKQEMKLAKLFLLVYYDRGVLINTPNDFDVQAVGSAIMSGSPGSFDGGFILMFGRVYPIC